MDKVADIKNADEKDASERKNYDDQQQTPDGNEIEKADKAFE